MRGGDRCDELHARERHAMKTSKFTQTQIAFALEQAELGTKVEEVCAVSWESEKLTFCRLK